MIRTRRTGKFNKPPPLVPSKPEAFKPGASYWGTVDPFTYVVQVVSRYFPGQVCDLPMVKYDRGEVSGGHMAMALMWMCEKRFAVAPLRLSSDRWVHANALIFDREKKIITRYDPEGDVVNPSGKAGVDAALWGSLSDAERRGWTYKTVHDNVQTAKCGHVTVMDPEIDDKPVDFSAMYSEFASTDEYRDEGFFFGGGKCTGWTALFLHLRLANPDKTDEEIVHHMYSYGRDKMEETAALFRNYVSFEAMVARGEI
jgi:hypothetical protein